MFAIFVALPVALIVGTWFFRNWQMQQALDAEIAAARDRGEAITIEDLITARPASPEIERTTGLWDRVVSDLDDQNVFQYASGRVEDLDRIRKGQDPFDIYGPDRCPFEPPREEPLSDEARYERTADGLLDHFRTTIDAAHEARRSGRDIAIEYSKTKHLNGLFAAHHRLASKPRELMNLEASRAIDRDDRDRLREALLTSIAIVELVEADPSGSGLLYSYSMLAVWRLNSLEPALEFGVLDASDLAEVQDALQNERTSEHLSAFGPQWRLLVLDSIDLRDKGREILPDELKPPPRLESLNVDDAWKAYEISRRYSEGATDPASAMEVATRLEKDVSDATLDAWRFYHSYQSLLNLRVGVGAILELAALRRVTATTIACERYRLDRGAWPGSLDELVPAYLDEPPVDPFDDQPLRYAVEGESIVVYSIGMDREDDGGIVDGPAAEGDTAMRLPPEGK